MDINNIDRAVALNKQLQDARTHFNAWKNWNGDHLCILTPIPHIVEGSAIEGIRKTMMDSYSILQESLVKEIESL